MIGEAVATEDGECERRDPRRLVGLRHAHLRAALQGLPAPGTLARVAPLRLAHGEERFGSRTSGDRRSDRVGQFVHRELLHPGEDRLPVAHVSVQAGAPHAELLSHRGHDDRVEAVAIGERCSHVDDEGGSQSAACHTPILILFGLFRHVLASVGAVLLHGSGPSTPAEYQLAVRRRRRVA